MIYKWQGERKKEARYQHKNPCKSFDMGKRSKAYHARINNLSNPIRKSSTVIVEEEDEDYSAQVQDEDLLEHGFFILDEYSDSDLDSDSDLSDLEDGELENELEGLQSE